MTAEHPMLLTDAERAVVMSIRAAVQDRTAIREMVRWASAETGIPAADLLGPRRRAELCRIREVIYRAAHRQGYSLAQIGQVFCRDHTTVLSGIRNLERRMQA